MKNLRDFFKGNGKNENGETLTLTGKAPSVEQETWYKCPMKCEGDKLYDAPGNCPVCNMKLAPVSLHGSKHQEYGHGGNSHHGCC